MALLKSVNKFILVFFHLVSHKLLMQVTVYSFQEKICTCVTVEEVGIFWICLFFCETTVAGCSLVLVTTKWGVGTLLTCDERNI